MRAAAAGLVTAALRPGAGAARTAWLPWLVRLCWMAVAGQLAVVAVARWAFALEVPTRALLAIVALTAASNLLLGRIAERSRPQTDAVAAGAIALDVVLLTTLLGLTGGPANPFSVLYLVHVALAALVLDMRATLAIAGLCVGCYATLFAWHVPVAWDLGAHAHHGGSRVGLHLQGMWAATALAAAAISYFVARTAPAHELGSPLATIAVAARELERTADGVLDPARVLEDARLIRDQALRCREILDRVSGEAGVDPGEGIEEIGLGREYDELTDRSLTVGARHEDHLLTVTRAMQKVGFEGFPNQRMDMVRNDELRLGIRYAGQYGWGALRASLYGQDVEHEISTGTLPWGVTVPGRGRSFQVALRLTF